jgi:hypothetical protein
VRRAWLELIWQFSTRQSWIRRAEAHNWVFVSGCNRSGKTTLSNLFRNHPQVSVIPNANTHTHAVPESTREGCPHIWAEQLERFRLTEASSRAPAARLIFDWLHYYQAPHSTIVLESDIPAVQMRWLQEVFPNPAFICVVRDGYAVAEALRLKEGYVIERCARQWAVSNSAMLEDLPHIRRACLIRYEDFVEQPRQVVSQLCDFLQLDASPLLPLVEQGWLLGNVDRNRSRLRNCNQELTGTLTEAEIMAIRENAGPMLDRLGYLEPVRK